MTLKKLIKYFLPYGLIIHKDKLFSLFSNRFHIIPQRKCPICGKNFLRFKSWSSGYGAIEQKDIVCSSCGSHPRHRKLWLYLLRKSNFFKMTGANFLHVAPEDCFKDKFISYAIYELKDSMTWSYYDIMNINRISIDVKVNYQSFLGEYS